MSSCVITGCAFILDDCAVWGDLHEEGNCWIFTCCLTPTLIQDEGDVACGNIPGEARWQQRLPPEEIKSVTYLGQFAAPFERRGVLVAAKSDCQLNKAARRYLE